MILRHKRSGFSLSRFVNSDFRQFINNILCCFPKVSDIATKYAKALLNFERGLAIIIIVRKNQILVDIYFIKHNI